MTAPAESREKILGRIRAATQTVANAPDVLTTAYSTLSRAYVRQGKLTPEASIDLMIERLREYDAEVVECFPAELPAAIAKQLAASGKHKFGLPTSEIEQAEGVLTASSCGIADSGTIVLHHSPTEGRRVLTLLPDWHLCILKASQVVETLPEYFTLFEHAPPIVTWISGPSAIKGVHGPRFLHVILVRDIS